MEPSHVLQSVDELADLYASPHQVVLDKVVDRVDPTTAAFIAAATLGFVASRDTAGRLDVSPRGGPAGFVVVSDERHVAIPDLNGNNRLDTLRNVIETGEAGLALLVPGRSELLRINGPAVVTTDPRVLGAFPRELRTPVSAIVVETRELFLHCAKALRRSGIWEAIAHPPSVPSGGELLAAQLGLDAALAAQVDAGLEDGYRNDLAADRRRSTP